MYYNPIQRRAFLKGMNGFLLAIPTLSSLTEKVYGAVEPEVKFVAHVAPLGNLYEHYWPSSVNTPMNLVAPGTWAKPLSQFSGDISPIYGKEFDPYRSKLTLIRGLDALTRSSHNTGVALAASQGIDNEASPSHFGTTIDAIMESSKNVYPTSPAMRALRIRFEDPTAYSSHGWFFYWRNRQKITALPTATAAFEALFGSFKPGTTGSTVNSEKTDQVSLIDRVLPEFNRVRNSPHLSADDKTNLENFIEHLHQTQKDLKAASEVQATCGKPDQFKPMKRSDHYSNQINVIVAALACNLTRVACLTQNYFIDSPSLSDPVHSVAHHYVHMAASPAQIPLFKAHCLEQSRFVSGRYLELIKKMDAISLGGSTLLDNSLVFSANELAEGATHTTFNMPVMIAGKAGGRIQAGNFIDYQLRPKVMGTGKSTNFGTFYNPAGIPYSLLLNDILRVMGVHQSEWELAGAGNGIGDWNTQGLPYYSKFLSNKNGSLPYFLKG